jgi:polyisoprenoid-binding protein YceI
VVVALAIVAVAGGALFVIRPWVDTSDEVSLDGLPAASATSAAGSGEEAAEGAAASTAAGGGATPTTVTAADGAAPGTGTGSGAGSGSDAAEQGFAGDWTVAAGEGVFVGYRVVQKTGGIERTLVGRTPTVSGGVTIDGSTLRAATITARLADLASDDRPRDNAVRTEYLDTVTYPDASFSLTGPFDLGRPAEGETVQFSVPGTLTLRDVTQPVTVDIQGRWTAGVLDLVGSTIVVPTAFGAKLPSLGGVASIDDQAVIEFQLRLVPAPDRPTDVVGRAAPAVGG